MAKYYDDYNRINWKNYPITDTPINEDNLNNMDSYLKTISERIEDISTYTPNIYILDELPEQGVEGLLYVVNNIMYVWDEDNSRFIEGAFRYTGGYYTTVNNTTNKIDSLPEIIQYTITNTGSIQSPVYTITCNKTFSQLDNILLGYYSGSLEEYIYPNYRFKVVAPDALDEWNIVGNSSVLVYRPSLISSSKGYEIIVRITDSYIYKITHTYGGTISFNKVAISGGGGGGTSYTAGDGIEISNDVISTPLATRVVYSGTWYYDNTLNSKTHTFSEIYAMRDKLTKENFHLFANGPADEEIVCDYFNISSSTLVLQFLYGFNVGATNKLYRIVITHSSDDNVQVGREQLINYTGLQNGLTAGTGIDITNGVISVDLDNAEDNSF